ncbi:unnamed protein product, partial [Amoebophrya sp. A25]
ETKAKEKFESCNDLRMVLAMAENNHTWKTLTAEEKKKIVDYVNTLTAHDLLMIVTGQRYVEPEGDVISEKLAYLNSFNMMQDLLENTAGLKSACNALDCDVESVNNLDELVGKIRLVF